MSSLKDAKVVVEEGGRTIWGQLPDIPYKSDKFGLGFTSNAQKAMCRARAGGQPLKIRNQEVNAVEDGEEDCSLERQSLGVYQTLLQKCIYLGSTSTCTFLVSQTVFVNDQDALLLFEI